MEIGAAYACGVPVFSKSPPVDITLKAYVTCVPSIHSAICAVRERGRTNRSAPHILLDPTVCIEDMHDTLDGLRPYLLGHIGDRHGETETNVEAARSIRSRFAGAAE